MAPSRIPARMLVLSFALALLGACAPAPAPVATAKNDPSNPSAPEGVPVTTSPSQEAAPGQGELATGAHEAHEHAPAADATYVCPMHPEVVSKEPGICPKCNMKLVPKK